MTDNLESVEAACAKLAAAGAAITFTAIAEHTGLSRTTLYRNPQLRAVIEEHRIHSHDHRALTARR
jgi:DNA-binding phage protein